MFVKVTGWVHVTEATNYVVISSVNSASCWLLISMLSCRRPVFTAKCDLLASPFFVTSHPFTSSPPPWLRRHAASNEGSLLPAPAAAWASLLPTAAVHSPGAPARPFQMISSRACVHRSRDCWINSSKGWWGDSEHLWPSPSLWLKVSIRGRKSWLRCYCNGSWPIERSRRVKVEESQWPSE